MKTEYITPETASNQSPIRKDEERLQEKKIPSTPNPGKNEGHNYGKGAPEETDSEQDFDPRNIAGGGGKDEGQDTDKGGQDYQEETNPATPPEKTRETPQANPQA